MRRYFCWLVLLALAAPAYAAGDPAYLQELQQQARARVLHAEPAWQRLLHYQDNRLFGGVTSAVDFPGFFLSPKGKTRPAEELDATLASFFSDEPRYDEPSQCRVKARYEWLKSQLAFDPARLPEQACTRYAEWSRGLNAEKLAVVFASNDLTGPSTMFGHTLLRVDARGQGKDDRLLAYAVNYAANTEETAGMTYALRGLTGSFIGTFAIFPYYEKVKEYARAEHRDLWEYRLNLAPEETERLLRHLWELRGVGFDYYFFTENCSYQLLSLIEVARPEVSLTARFRGWPPYAIPIDTVRQLEAEGVLEEVEYRPAQAQRLKYRLSQLSEPQRRWVLDYAGKRAGLDDPRLADQADAQRANLLELAHDYLYFQYQESHLARETGAARAREALVARSRIAVPTEAIEVPVPPVSPDHGHPSGRLSLGYRAGGDRTAALFRVRPAYHDRLDPPEGYLAGGEIEFLDLGFIVDEERIDLDEFRALSVQAIAPRDEAFKPWSWQVSTGVRRFDDPAVQTGRSLGAFLDGGGGMAWSPASGIQTYIFAFAEADLNRGVNQGYAFAAGTRQGIAVQGPRHLTQQLEADALADAAGGAEDVLRLKWSGQWQIAPRDGLRLALNHERFQGDRRTTLQLLWQRYF